MTVLFIRRTVKQSREEYIQLQELNTELTKKVKERTRELELVNEQKTNTFVNLAHETRTPLTLINNYLHEYIGRHGESEELEVIKNGIGKLTKDIINFFDIERISKGFLIYNHDQICDFSQILNENIQLFRKYAAKKNIMLKTAVVDTQLIKADPNALIRIINNLIENAIRYTKEGGWIYVKLLSDENNILFSVQDNGIGIPKNLHLNIFEPYFQINTQKKNFQGMGLGLPIVKMIADSLQGDIKVISDPEIKSGTEVIIKFKKHELKAGESIIEFSKKDEFSVNIDNLKVSDDVIDEERHTIMVIEDNVDLLSYIVSKLKTKYNTLTASSGNEALEKLKNTQQLDLIISDIMMDNGNGIDFLKQISKQSRYKHLPLIFITAKHNPEDKLEALSLGAIDYIYKPFLIEELVIKVDSVLRNLQKQRKALLDAAYKALMITEKREETATSNGNKLIEEACLKYKLTNRERDVILLLAGGCSNKSIAEKLFISDKTVAKHIQNIFEKVEVNSRVELLSRLGINLNMSDN